MEFDNNSSQTSSLGLGYDPSLKRTIPVNVLPVDLSGDQMQPQGANADAIGARIINMAAGPMPAPSISSSRYVNDGQHLQGQADWRAINELAGPSRLPPPTSVASAQPSTWRAESVQRPDESATIGSRIVEIAGERQFPPPTGQSKGPSLSAPPISRQGGQDVTSGPLGAVNRNGGKPVAPPGIPNSQSKASEKHAAGKSSSAAKSADEDRGLRNRSRRVDYPDYTLVGGDRSFRINNPGNIIWGPFARDHGATGSDYSGFAIFPNWKTGQQAQNELWHTKPYQDRTIDGAVRLWTTGDPKKIQDRYVADVARAAGVSPNVKVSSLTPAQMEQLHRAQRPHESRIGGKIIYKPDLSLAQVATSWTAGDTAQEQKTYIAALARQLGVDENAKMSSLTPEQTRQIEEAQVRYMGLNPRLRPAPPKPKSHPKPKASHMKITLPPTKQ